jgi:hypothetical protein
VRRGSEVAKSLLQTPTNRTDSAFKDSEDEVGIGDEYDGSDMDSTFGEDTAAMAFVPGGDDLYDPNFMWFANRGTQCRTPDAMAPSAFEMANSVEPPSEVFSVPLADYRAKASQNVDDDDSDDDKRKGRLTFHSPPKAGAIMMRLAGSQYGFCSNRRLRNETMVPLTGRKTADKSAQTTDRRVMNRTKFTPVADPIVQPQDALGVSTNAPPQAGKARRGGPAARAKPGVSAPASLPAAKLAAQSPAKGAFDDAETGDASASPPVLNLDGQMSASVQDPNSVPDARLSPKTRTLASRGGTRVNRLRVPRRAARGTARGPETVKDPSEDFQWLEGIGNVPRRHNYYEQMRSVKPKERPSSAAISAAMNEEPRVPDVGEDADTADGENSTPGIEALSASGGDVRRGVGRASDTPQMSEASYGTRRTTPQAAAMSSQRVASTPSNPYEVEERRLPPLPPSVRRAAALPADDGTGASRRAYNANPWADVVFSYDVRKALPSSPDRATTGRRGDDRPLPALHPEETLLDGSPIPQALTARTAGPASAKFSPLNRAAADVGTGDQSPVLLPVGSTGAFAAGGAAKDSAKDMTTRTAKQQLLDREREFARMFPDWINNDDRLRPNTRGATSGTRTSRR